MSVIVPENYPTGCSDEELANVLDELLQEQITWGGSQAARTVSAGDVRLNSLISAGQLQLQKRLLESTVDTSQKLHHEIVSLKNITREYSDGSKRFAKYSTWLAVLAIFIAIIAEVTTVTTAIQSDRSQKQWQDSQTKLLTEIEQSTANKQLETQQLNALTQIEQNTAKQPTH